MPRRRPTVDHVAVILALALLLAVALVMTAVILNVVSHKNPTPTLGENATQVVVAVMGGLIGVLGGYVGARTRRPDDDDRPDQERKRE